MEAVFLSFILMLSIFLGFELISKVPATLHTPLMSGANAISGITVLGALVAAGADNSEMATWLGAPPSPLLADDALIQLVCLCVCVRARV